MSETLQERAASALARYVDGEADDLVRLAQDLAITPPVGTWQDIATAPDDESTLVAIYMGDWREPTVFAARRKGDAWLVGEKATVSAPTLWHPLSPLHPASPGGEG